MGNFTSRKKSHPTDWIKKRPSQPEMVNAMHKPAFIEKQKRCKHCTTDKAENEPGIFCESCNVYLAYRMEATASGNVIHKYCFELVFPFTAMRILFSVYLLF